MSALGLDPLPRGVILAATPLGNVGDASARLMQALAHADVIAAEDTRRVRNLAQALGIEISGSVVSNFDHNEQARAQQLIDAAQHGTVLVVTDAGMPIISDPGLSLVAAAAERDIPVTCFPGPSAVPTALALSGLGVGHFLFDAFLRASPVRERRGWNRCAMKSVPSYFLNRPTASPRRLPMPPRSSAAIAPPRCAAS